ncbi:uncharacterized protein LOC121878639 [Homarus americanus]|uniref:Uncharacterized protein n=1 Tax=Homarus americanus TaxID=6706 RepID=A0A8J5MP72_HOMAM|nr:uncharacterized protein LOC121878639 [Homarus americanus]KAG7158540.1 hypothetical protein Hamer_G021114 [Homarus americanus]
MPRSLSSGMVQEGGRLSRPPENPTPHKTPETPDTPLNEEELTPVPMAGNDEEPDVYIDTNTGKKMTNVTPCCGCRTCDARFPLEMDEETSYVYREAKYCKLSYTFISSWCLMLFVATAASSGIIAIGFLDKELIKYQVVGIVLTIIFGAALPVFLVFWVCLRRREAVVRRRYRAQKNSEQVLEREGALPPDDKKKNKEKKDENGKCKTKKDKLEEDDKEDTKIETPPTPGSSGDTQLLMA